MERWEDDPLVAPRGGRVIDATPQQKIRKLLMFATTCATIAAFVAVAAGYGAKPTRVQRAELALSRAQVGSSEAENAYRQLKAALHDQELQMKKLDTSETMSGGMAKHAAQKHKEARRITKLQDQAPGAPVAPVTELQDDGASDAAPAAAADAPADAPVEDAEAADSDSKIPDPEEAKKAAAEAAKKAGAAVNNFSNDAMKAVNDLLPGGDLMHAFHWHIDVCLYILTMYAVYYVWLCQLWEKILPRLKFSLLSLATIDTPRTLALKNKTCEIGKWGDGPTYDDNGNSTLPCDQDLLWFRTAKGEVAHFVDSKRVMPGLIDTLMCGCGGNVYAVAVTSKRLIVQNDKRCMFGKTVLTTNEDSIFVENIHKAALFTDGSLNLGVTVLHSFDMLRGGFNWIFFGLLVDIILEWKPTWMKLLGDARLQGWINMVPDDVIFMFASFCVLFGCFLFVALLWFLIMPQSVLEIEVVKQSGMDTYMRKFELPVGKAYQMYDAVMRGICEADLKAE